MPNQKPHSPHQGSMSPLPQTFHLPSFLGIPPHRYLAWFFFLFLALLVVFLLGFPGFWRPQGYLSLDTLPQRSQVYVDDQYYGETPLKVKLAAGTHLVRFEKAFFKTEEHTLDIKKHIFVQLFSKPKQYFSQRLTLKENNNYNTLRFYWQDYVLRGLESRKLATFGRGYAFPPLLQTAFRDLAYAREEQLPKELYPLFASLLSKTTNRYQLSDLLNASVIASSPRKIPSILQFTQLLKQLPEKIELQNREELELWLNTVAPSLKLSDVWLERFFTQTQDISKNFKKNSLDQNVFLKINGVGFLRVRSEKNDFYIQQSEVSYQQYANFIAEEPQWSKRRSSFNWQKNFPKKYGEQELINEPWQEYEQLHTKGYLSPWSNQEAPPLLKDYPLSYIDYTAANAYATWFSKKVIPVLGDCWQASLPESKQWQQVYMQSKKIPSLEQRNSFAFPPAIPFDEIGNEEIFGLDGGVSEWMSNSYQAYTFWQADAVIKPLISWLDPPLVEIQGSNWLNDKMDDTKKEGWLLQNNFDLPADTNSYKAVFPATLVSAFVGFRLVLEENCSTIAG